MFNGNWMWKPAVVACTRYRVTNPDGSAYGRCMKMYPVNKEGLFHHRLDLGLAIRLPALRSLLIRLDDPLEYDK